ncbi:MAG: hypothetical protein JXQ90_18035 [Cyclobacteriaceae bacterium]
MKMINKYFMSPANCFGIVFLLAIMLVASSIYGQLLEYGIIRDVSESSGVVLTLNADDVFKKVIPDLELEGSKKGVNLRTTTCGENMIPRVNLAQLAEDDSFFGSISARNNAIGEFLAKGKADLDHLVGLPCDEQQTNLYRTIVHILRQYDPKSEEKKLVILSDLVEASSVLNMHVYEDDPSALLSSFDELVAALEADVKMPSLVGMEVVLVTPGNSELQLWAARFWSKWLISKGCEVRVQAAF